MNTLFSYIRVFVFLGCTLIGIQVPALVSQYGKSLDAHLVESQIALASFKNEADKYFNGSIEQLIAHYKENNDKVFNAGGESIQSIYERNLMLKKKYAEFQSGPWAAYTQALFAPVSDVKNEVLKNYSYAIQLQPRAIAFGMIVGLIFTIAFEILLKLLLQVPKLFNRRSRAAHGHA